MKKYLLGLFVGFLSIAFSGNVFAKPDFGTNCGSCHGVPVVTNFQLPSSHDSTTVPIDSFVATDSDRYNKTRVNGYLLTTSAAAPSSSDPGWQSSPPSQFTFTSDGLQTLYAWAKDTFGSVSTAVSEAVDILIVVPNSPPVADAGPNQTVQEGVTVTLDGSNSDDSDNGIATYLWEQVPGTVAVAISDPAAMTPTFSTPNVGPGGAALTFRLTVSDGQETDTDTTIVNVSWVNIEPVANAGADRAVAEGTPVRLDGSASDGIDDGIDTYSWSQVDINGVIAELVGPNTPTPEFTITDVGADGASLTFELTVTDDGGLAATDRVVVNVTNINQVPVANAGANQIVAANAEVILDASGSSDPDTRLNPDTAYTWKQTAGQSVTLSAPGAIKPAFTAPDVADGTSETLSFELTVTDGQLQATDICQIQVNGATPPPVVEEEPPVVEEEPPVVEEEPPVVEKEPPVVEEEPPVVEKEPPVVEEEPPVVEEEPPVIGPPVAEPPSAELMRKYRRLAKKSFYASKTLKMKSWKAKRMYRRALKKDPAAAQAYMAKAMDYKAQSLDARYQAKKYMKLYRQVKRQLGSDGHDRDDRRDRDKDDDDHDKDDDDRDEDDDDDREREDDDDDREREDDDD